MKCLTHLRYLKVFDELSRPVPKRATDEDLEQWRKNREMLERMAWQHRKCEEARNVFGLVKGIGGR
jgi:hypothetical protein